MRTLRHPGTGGAGATKAIDPDRLRAARDRWTCSDPERAARRVIPASTFKIFNSLMALETGAIADDEVVIPWDGVDRGSPGWNRDQTLRTAFRRSAVWAYRELARRIGEERMRAFVRREGYGNADIGGGIDRFWLTGDLGILTHRATS